MIGLKSKKVALVHDYLNQYGGAERVLESFAEMFPEAPIYTLFYDKALMRGKFKDRIINTSFLDNIFVRRKHRAFIPLFPKAAEFINLKDKYDLIVSDSAGFGKGISHSRGVHISYIHSPLRYAWEPENYLESLLPKQVIKASRPILSYLRRWDREAGQKPNIVIANSKYIAGKIKDYYERDAYVIYPPVDDRIFFLDSVKALPDSIKDVKGKYFLAFGRLIHYKRFDLIIEAFNTLNLPLIIAGTGPEKEKLKNLITSNKIKILDNRPSDEELRIIIANAEALIFPQSEDFGLAAAESIVCGTPVIAYADGGAKEIVQEGQNGLFFKKQTPDSLIKAVISFKQQTFNREKIQRNAKKFSKENFKNKFSEILKRNNI